MRARPTPSALFLFGGPPSRARQCVSPPRDCGRRASTTVKVVPRSRVDATFHCEGLTTSLAGTPYTANVADGAIGGTLEFVA